MFYRRTTLENGITVMTERMDEVRSVALGIWFAVGSRDEAPADAGMSHFMEHMIFKGTPTRSPREISEAFDRPVAVYGYPSAIKAFYMKPQQDRPEVSLSVDFLSPEGYGEIIGGGQRLEDYDLLLQRIEEHHLPREAFEWYLDLRRYGSVPHAGFGMGIERVVAWICGIDHLREAIPYPRMLYRLTP
jgi:asparaginyl-tRNA synthetase